MNRNSTSKFVVVTTQRTGATFFRTCLESHPQVACPGTIFPQVTRFKYFSVDRKDSYYRRFRTRTFKWRLSHWLDRSTVVHACLDDAYRSETGGIALGYKISYSNLERYPSILSWLQDNDVRVIHWLRRNVLKTYVSYLTKGVRKKAHYLEPAEKITVQVDPGKLRRNLERQMRLREKYSGIFKESRYLEMSYESFVKNQKIEGARVLRFLGVDESVSMHSPLVKQNSDDLREVIGNYAELWQALRGTPYEEYLVSDVGSEIVVR